MRGILLPGADAFSPPRPTWRMRMSRAGHLATRLSLVALAVTLAIAMSLGSAPSSPARGEMGLVVQLVVDRSGSMRKDDVRLPRSLERRASDDINVEVSATIRLSRLDAVRVLCRSMLDTERSRDGGFGLGRPSDFVGLVSFAGTPRADALPQRDRNFVLDQLRSLRTVATSSEDGTAIGDAIALAVDGCLSLRPTGSQTTGEADSIAGGEVIVLLTDGLQNAGTRSVDDATAIAAAEGIPVYIVGLRPSSLSAAEQRVWEESDRSLAEAARQTGGRFLLVRDFRSLPAVFHEIDSLERSERSSERDPELRSPLASPIVLAGIELPSPLTIVLIGLFAGSLLSSIAGRTLR